MFTFSRMNFIDAKMSRYGGSVRSSEINQTVGDIVSTFSSLSIDLENEGSELSR